MGETDVNSDKPPIKNGLGHYPELSKHDIREWYLFIIMEVEFDVPMNYMYLPG